MRFSTRNEPESSEQEPKTATNQDDPQKIIIGTHPQPRAAKRLRLGGIKPLKLTNITTLSAVFPKAQRSQAKAKRE